jgi:hypothetical protein
MLIFILTKNIEAKSLELPTVDPDNFDDPLDNPYLPMALGDTYVYLAETEDEVIINEITNTSDTVEILGITCTVVYDVEWVEVEIDGVKYLFKIEETNDWYAWDNDGNVWYFGEDTREYLYDEEWKPIGTTTEGSWKAGVDGAEPGILMLANPMPGLSYQQEYYEDEAEDMGKVLKLNSNVSIKYGDYEGCLKTKEWTRLEPGHIEHKYYYPGVGLVFIEELKEKTIMVELDEIY